ncbi:MAG: pantoate/beta-alanine ligase [Pseudonocardiales bacterium]|nr:pantoate/beta-alanine ligase [Pseudonocardiales bacterium]
MTSRLVHSRAEFLAARAELPGRIGAVLTMGALHRGHEALLANARVDADSVIATIFVNPAQFGPNEDLSKYPRTLAEDFERCSALGADLVWAPEVHDVYAAPPTIGIDSGLLGSDLEGASRVGHFAGMLLVVNKFLHLLRPDSAFFGEKDYQQLALVQAMVTDLDLGVEIIGVPTVREEDGLALSSRNVYLSASDRLNAVMLSRALFAGQMAGPHGPSAVFAAATGILERVPGLDVDYLALRATDLGPTPLSGPARLLVAARVGKTRLIDNVLVELEAVETEVGS